MKYMYLLMSLLFSACTSSHNIDTTVLKFGIEADPVSLDPFDALEGYSLQARAQVYETLIELKDGKFQPLLAEKWEYLSPTAVKFTLKTNVYFHNGELFTPADVKFTIDRQKTSIPNKALYDLVTNVTISGSNSVTVYLSQPFAPFLSHMTLPNMYIVNQKAIESFGQDYSTQAVGTGAFKFDEWQRGSYISFVRNDNYHSPETQTKISNLIFQVVPDAASRGIVLETGEVQVIRDLELADVERLAKIPNLAVEEFVVPNVFFISFNLKEPLMADIRVRQAISLAINREGILKNVYFDKGVVASSMVPITVFGHTNLSWEYNLEKAKSLIQAANAVDQTIKVYILVAQLRAAEILQNDLKQIGLNLDINVLEPASYYQLIKSGDHHMHIRSWNTLTSDADYALRPLVVTGENWNFSGYSNPRVDQLILQARGEMDNTKRLQMYYEVQSLLNQDLPYIPFMTTYAVYAKDKSISGLFNVAGSSIINFRRAAYTN